MSERKEGFLWITLGYYERMTDGNTLEKVKRDKDSLVRALRRFAESNGIKFAAYGCIASCHISNSSVEFVERGYIAKEDFMTNNQCPLHVHVLVWTSARATVKQFIGDWWRKHGYGIEQYNVKAKDSKGHNDGTVKIKPLDLDTDGNYLRNIVNYIKLNYKYSRERCMIRINLGDSRELGKLVYFS